MFIAHYVGTTLTRFVNVLLIPEQDYILSFNFYQVQYPGQYTFFPIELQSSSICKLGDGEQFSVDPWRDRFFNMLSGFFILKKFIISPLLERVA